VDLLCPAAEQRDLPANVPPSVSITAVEEPCLTETELGAFRWLEQKDSEKAETLRQALQHLREKNAEKSRQDQIDHALEWLENEDQERGEQLRLLRGQDPERFEAEFQEVIVAEIDKTLKLRSREMIRAMIFGTVGGLGLFLFGMLQMSEGLKKAAGKKLKKILESMTKNRVIGCLVGAGHGFNPIKLCCNRYGRRFRQCRTAYTQAGNIRDYRYERRNDGDGLACFYIRYRDAGNHDICAAGNRPGISHADRGQDAKDEEHRANHPWIRYPFHWHKLYEERIWWS